MFLDSKTVGRFFDGTMWRDGGREDLIRHCYFELGRHGRAEMPPGTLERGEEAVRLRPFRGGLFAAVRVVTEWVEDGRLRIPLTEWQGCCACCDSPFTLRRPYARYCSTACRNKAHATRHAGTWSARARARREQRRRERDEYPPECAECGALVRGRRRRFCSARCRKLNWYYRNARRFRDNGKSSCCRKSV
jgi:hypothetical protein